MIIRGVLVFLSVVDFVCDTFNKVKSIKIKTNNPSAVTKEVLAEAKTSILV